VIFCVLEDAMPDQAPRTVRHVLIVEDDDSIAQALEYIVVRSGATHDRVATGGLAMARIRETHPDLVLLDVMLPGVSGYDICRDVRGDPDLGAVKILMMTARGSAVERQKGMALGADGFIQKPFAMQDLRREVARLLA
jgi:two-component system, OmpR family, phosphate regulon response regulator PhoB